jgi:hypothetical protein
MEEACSFLCPRSLRAVDTCHFRARFCELGSSASEQGLVAVACRCDSEASGSIESRHLYTGVMNIRIRLRLH